MTTATIDAETFAEATATFVHEWGLPSDAMVTAWPTGEVNATLPDGTTVYDLTAGNPAAAAEVTYAFRRGLFSSEWAAATSSSVGLDGAGSGSSCSESLRVGRRSRCTVFGS